MPLSCFHHFCAGASFSSRKPHGRAIYEAIVSNLGRPGETLSTEEGTRMRAWAFATSMQHARARYALETGANQTDPRLLAEPFVAEREAVHGLTPGPNESFDDRRRAVAAARLARYGASHLAARAAFVALLGRSFRGYRDTRYDEAVVHPAVVDIDASVEHNFVPLDGATSPKLLRLIDPVLVNLGSPQWVRYEPVGGSAFDVVEDERYMVDPGLSTRRERVKIDAVDPGSATVAPSVRAVFAKAHGAGTLLTSANYPYWTSTKRHVTIVLSEAAAKNPEIRARTMRLARRVVRGVCTFAVVQEDPNAPRYTGAFLSDTSWPSIQTMEDVELSPLNQEPGSLPESFGDEPPAFPP